MRDHTGGGPHPWGFAARNRARWPSDGTRRRGPVSPVEGVGNPGQHLHRGPTRIGLRQSRQHLGASDPLGGTEAVHDVQAVEKLPGLAVVVSHGTE
jgi:hypothetical protein